MEVCGDHQLFLSTCFTMSSFVFGKRKKLPQVRNNMRVSKWFEFEFSSFKPNATYFDILYLMQRDNLFSYMWNKWPDTFMGSLNKCNIIWSVTRSSRHFGAVLGRDRGTGLRNTRSYYYFVTVQNRENFPYVKEIQITNLINQKVHLACFKSQL